MGGHQPVLLNEVLEALAIIPTGIYIDGTFGRGGHSLAILQRLGPHGRLLALDRDREAIDAGKQGPFRDDPRFCIVHGTWTTLEKQVQDRGWHGKVNGVLLDLGVSSPQLDDETRGFSFAKDGPLDMRMDTSQGMSAATWINQASEQHIRQVLWELGEERFAKRIAKSIVTFRQQTPITRTAQLSNIVKQAVPVYEKKHPATRSFQAIRIFINNELIELQNGLMQSVAILATGGRLCVISFHSIEDGIVKQFIQRESQGETLLRDVPLLATQLSHRLKKVDGLVRPSEQEISVNTRARSARLRTAEKL